MSALGTDWTVTMDQGKIVSSDANGLTLSEGPRGIIEFDAGGTIEFEDITQIITEAPN